MKNYLKDSSRPAAENPTLDLTITEESSPRTFLKSLIRGITFCEFCDAQKRALFYSDKTAKARYRKSQIKEISKLKELDALNGTDLVLSSRIDINTIHAILGIISEAGEIAEELVNSKLENRSLNKVNISEELGDILWYVALLLREFDLTFEEVATKNTNKLKIRYPEKFNKLEAIHRDTDKELTSLV